MYNNYASNFKYTDGVSTIIIRKEDKKKKFPMCTALPQEDLKKAITNLSYNAFTLWIMLYCFTPDDATTAIKNRPTDLNKIFDYYMSSLTYQLALGELIEKCYLIPQDDDTYIFKPTNHPTQNYLVEE